MTYSQDELKMNCRYPEGEAGRQTLMRMNESHHDLTEWGLEHLRFNSADSVLDIGCGGGMALKRVSEDVTRGRLCGIDISPLSIKIAEETNEETVREGRMSFCVASVDDLPFPDRSFDKVISVESFYFWPDQDKGLQEIVRVMKEGGLLMIALEYRSDMKKDDLYYHNIELLKMNVPDAATLTAAYERAGLSKVRSSINGNWLCVVGEK